MEIFEKIRNERKNFPAVEHSAYFESAATGLIPKYVFEAVNRYQEARYVVGGDSTWGSDECDSIEMMGDSRCKLAKMINADAEDISFAMNTSHGLSFFTSNINIEKGSNVIIPENAYNTGKFLWQVREKEGLEIRYAKSENGCVSVQSILDLIDENTVAVHCSYVESSTGFRLDAKRIGEYCRNKKIFFVLDATQALGALQVDVQELCVDVLAGNDYKWMMNYGGTGYVYIRKDVRKQLKTRSAGWMSDQNRFYMDADYLTLRNDGGKFELGFPSMSGIYGLGLVADKYTHLGSVEIEKYIFSICEYLRREVRRTDGIELKYDFLPENQSQILYIKISDKFDLSKEKLKEKGVMCDVRQAEESGETLLRIAVHYYNNEEDVDKLIEAIIS